MTHINTLAYMSMTVLPPLLFAVTDEDEVKATVSALTYILTSAAKYGVSEAILCNELQQIGFPREHGQALCRVYSDQVTALTGHLRKVSLRTARLVDVKTKARGTHCDLTLTYWSAETGTRIHQEHHSV
ncbi:COMM domain-containing protein 4-like [Homalodisca vitripennis]|uniref:COMM domain-containing protein 4-like n=1 Tax=Homalodisca vitripennis TaxID=197043 RepID=UPI001EEAD789|nr:COMM domain-containing protein 4-like [Homalodisca vitripennis]